MGCANSSEINQQAQGKESTKIRHKDKNINLRKKSILQSHIQVEQLQYLKEPLSSQQVEFAITRLSGHQLFSSLSKKDIVDICSGLDVAESNQDEYVFKQGDPGLRFFIIYKGKVDVMIDNKLVRTLAEGQCFGELALLLKCSRTASVICRSEKCQFLVMKPEQYKSAIQKMKKEEYARNIQTIQKVPLFCCLTNKQKFAVSNYVKQMSFNRNDVIFKVGDDAQLIYIISEGQVQIQIDGKQDMILKTGQIFGEASIQEKMKRSGTAIARTKLITSILSRTDIESVLGESLQNLVFYNTKKWALLRSKTFKQFEPHINTIITSFESFFVKNGAVIDTRIYNGFIISLQGKINDKPDGVIFNEQAWSDPSHKGQRLIKNGQGQCAYLSFSKARQLLKNIQNQLLMVNTSQKLMETKKPQFQMSLQDFLMVKKLGQGQYGEVYLVKNTKYGSNLYALKCLKKAELQSQDMMAAVAYERNILQKTIFPFIVGYVKAFHSPQHIFLLMEYIHGREMFDVIRQVDTMSPSMTRYFIACLIISVQFLHSQNIIYRDLKPQNSVVDHKGKVYLIDLGTAKLLKAEDCYKTFTIIGTPHYMAPEVFEGNGYSLEVDYWSLGCILFQFLCYRVPFGQNLNDPYQIYSVVKKQNIRFSSSLKDPDAKELISMMLNKNPKARSLLTFDRIKGSKYFTGFDWAKLLTEEIQPPYIPKQFKEGRLNSLMKLEGKNFLKNYYKDTDTPQISDWDQNY